MNYLPYAQHLVVNYDETRVCASDTDDVAWVFGDQFASHKSPDTVEFCLKRMVMLWLFSVNCSSGSKSI